GQTPIDYLDLESVGRVEVLRGSASSLYGNAAGGVIDIRSTQPAPGTLSGELRASTGSFGASRLFGKASGGTRAARYQASIARTTADGFRDYSEQRQTNAFARASLERGDAAYALTWMAVDLPVAQNPGSLTKLQLLDNPEMADPLAVRKQARKAVRQSQVGFTFSEINKRGELEGSFHGGVRSLDNPLSFGIVDVARTSWGAGYRATIFHSLLGAGQRFTAGSEIQKQNDRRLNFANCNDAPAPPPTLSCPTTLAERGAVTLNQRELVTSSGSYIRNETPIGSRVLLSGGVRADEIRFDVRDRLVTGTNPDDSGVRTLYAVSPALGIVTRLSGAHSLYANISRAFETPTATELGNQPDGSAGLNRVLEPQRSTSYEAGLKGVSRRGIQYNLALYRTRVADELIPFEIPASGGRRYFRNAGSTRRTGAEMAASAVIRGVDAGITYAISNFRFRDYLVGAENFAGRRIPGVAPQVIQTSAHWKLREIDVVVEGLASGRVEVNDANSESAPGFALFNARLSRNIVVARARLRFTAGVQNALDRVHASSVSVNAAGGKYYEPGARRALFISVGLDASRPVRGTAAPGK
ncbi:MAG TPA: TonB-dependent receptor, partial [Gemmatimonadaceae bacterium]|nr:TonB-dependent receptor [Gemmatimonadaceae bacterium]